MHPKIKSRPTGRKSRDNRVEPLLPHEVNSQMASINAAARHSMNAVQSASGSANHARHHVSRQTQS
jgi:hypothetical protein